MLGNTCSKCARFVGGLKLPTMEWGLCKVIEQLPPPIRAQLSEADNSVRGDDSCMFFTQKVSD